MSTGKTCNDLDLVVFFLLSPLFITGFFPPEEEGEDIILGLGNEGKALPLPFLFLCYTLKNTHTAYITV